MGRVANPIQVILRDVILRNILFRKSCRDFVIFRNAERSSTKNSPPPFIPFHTKIPTAY